MSIETKFLETLGFHGAQQNDIDVEYMKEVYWEIWENVQFFHG